MINWNENESDNEKYIIWLIDLDVDMDSNIKNIACRGKAMCISNEQHLSNISASIHENVKQHWGWVEKKACNTRPCLLNFQFGFYYEKIFTGSILYKITSK